MRQSIILLIALLVAVVLYTAYGLMTFEPDPASPFTFAEPVIPPEIMAANVAKAASGTEAGVAQQEQTDAAMARMTQAITLYQSYEKDASPQAVSTFSIINAAVFNGRLPAYLLSQSKNTAQVRNFELLTLDPKKVASIRPGESALTCGLSGDVLVGDNGDNRIVCETAAPPTALDRLFLGGPGNDDMISAYGNRILNAGTGDDKMTAGPGRTIVILDDAWGKDTLTVDCTHTKVNLQSELPTSFPIPWVQPYTNFILLSPRINPADVEWNGLVLTNKTTGDTLSVNEKCFNLVSAGQASTE